MLSMQTETELQMTRKCLAKQTVKKDRVSEWRRWRRRIIEENHRKLFTRLIVLNILKYLPSCAQTVHSHSHFWEQFDLRKEQEREGQWESALIATYKQQWLCSLVLSPSLSCMCMRVYVSVRVLYAMLLTGAGAADCMQVNFLVLLLLLRLLLQSLSQTDAPLSLSLPPSTIEEDKTGKWKIIEL